MLRMHRLLRLLRVLSLIRMLRLLRILVALIRLCALLHALGHRLRRLLDAPVRLGFFVLFFFALFSLF